MTEFRFLHAADVHLDSPVGGLRDYPGASAHRYRAATREAFDRLVETAIRDEVAFVVIAGDLYDGDWKDFSTGLFFVAQMGRLNEAGIPVYLLHGNHDAESVITRRLELPSNVHVFAADRPSTFEVEECGVALHGQSYAERAVLDNLVPGYPGPVAGAFNIGVLHSALAGAQGHEPYAPCTLADLVSKGYGYWALGHVHQREVLHEHPHVVFPGNLQGRHIRETGAKGASLVTARDREVSAIDHLALDVVRWALVRVDVADAATPGDVNEQIRAAIESAVMVDADGPLLLCRVVVEGPTDLHARLLGSREDLLADARAAALGLGEDIAWVEKVVVATEARREPASIELADSLRHLFDAAARDEAFVAALETDLAELVRRLPHEVRSDPGDAALAAAVEGDCAALIARLSPDLYARMITC